MELVGLGLVDGSSVTGRISREVLEIIDLGLLASCLDVVVNTLVPTPWSLFW